MTEGGEDVVQDEGTTRHFTFDVGDAEEVEVLLVECANWERGHDEPRLSTLAAIARATGRRLRVELVDDGVDRAQIRQQLTLTPEQRLASVTNLSRTLATARRVP